VADLDILRALEQRSTSLTSDLTVLNAYYDGEVRLAAVGISLPPEMRQLTTVINWPRMQVDSVEERLDIEGFRIAGSPGLDDRLWDWWQSNDLDDESSLGHIEALVSGRAYIVVGFDDDDPTTPLITVESSRAMTVDVDSRTRKVTAALRLYSPNEAGDPQSATLYLPNVTRYYVKDNGGWTPDPDLADIEHDLGEVPVVPLTNRARLADRDGRSEMADVMGLTDAACRTLTNLQGAQELLAVPQRYVLGATKEDFVDADGNRVPAWQAYIGRIMALGNEEAKVGQFTAADLRNFTEVLNQYARMVAAITGLPPHYLGFTSDNPASADAIRSSEARLVKRAERRARSFSGAWETALRLAIRLIDGVDTASRLETVWRDPSTPTFAAKADAVTKLFAAGLIPKEAAWDALGYSAEQQRQYDSLMSDDPFDKLMRSVGVSNGAGSVPGSTGPGVPDPAAAAPAGLRGAAGPVGLR
jgi:hypothetical protein